MDENEVKTEGEQADETTVEAPQPDLEGGDAPIMPVTGDDSMDSEEDEVVTEPAA